MSYSIASFIAPVEMLAFDSKIIVSIFSGESILLSSSVTIKNVFFLLEIDVP